MTVLSDFLGLNLKKRDDANGVLLPAKKCINTDLRGGTIRPFKANLFAERGHRGEIVKYDNEWFSGKENYVTWTINGFELLIYRDGQDWKQVVRQPRVVGANLSNTVVDLGLPQPGAPSVSTLPFDDRVTSPEAHVNNPYRMGYFTTWIREVEGYREESSPSPFTYASNNVIAFNIQVTGTVPDNIVGGRLYRFSEGKDSTVTAGLVAEFTSSSFEVDDHLLGDQLGSPYSGFFTTAVGVRVLRFPPDVVFDGICPTIHNGRLVAWHGSNFYFSEGNEPGSFPAAYMHSAGDKIISIESYNGELYIFTRSGIQRVVGQDPVEPYVVPMFQGDGISSRRAVTSAVEGVYYLCRRGLGIVNSGGARLISRDFLPETYFDDIDVSTAHLASGIGLVLLFHSKGALALVTERGRGFVELDQVYTGSFFDKQTGKFFVTTGEVLQELWGGDDYLDARYKFGDLVLNLPEDKEFESFTMVGSGTFTVTLSLDGEDETVDVFDLSEPYEGRTIQPPEGVLAHGAALELVGRGELKEIRVNLTVGDE